ncbi:MAG TPA: acetylxylan esterase [Prolixibacteraceae bacterium]|nr:acetylxylan esterase [Prolixibacteraceae bacterium]
MNIKRNPILLVVGFVIMLGFGLQAQQPVTQGRQMDYESKLDSVRSYADYFTPATNKKMTPDADGFIRRWTLLEPISKPNRSNTVFTDSYLRKTFDTLYFANQFTVLPKNGEKVKVGEQELMWHALDSKIYNTKLFRFAYGLKKPIYGVIFWAVTVVNAPQEMKNVRMAVGSNSASMWWLNREEAVLLSGDRRMVMDDAVSPRLTLKKGKNIVRGVVINGPGMSDFCVRFLDEKGEPVKDLTITCE